MRRKIYSELSSWKDSDNRKPLMVLGCRQVGKTHSIREFLSVNYESHLEINLERDPQFKMYFEGSLNPTEIIDRLIIATSSTIEPRKSAIFIDEIQSCPEAISSLKWFAEDGRYDVIVSGSHLGVKLNAYRGDMSEPISPLGYVKTLEMYPMDFEEFIWAMGVDERLVDSARRSIRSLSEVDEVFNKILTDLFLRYLIVGGMPEAVKTYANTRNYVKTKAVIKDILRILGSDVTKYSPNVDRMKIMATFESIPSQLASGKRNFQYSQIEKKTGVGERMYGDALEWLVNCGMVYRCWNLSSPVPPLSHNVKSNMFKLYACDTGLLLGLMDDADSNAIVNLDPYSNNGIVMENSIASMLVCKGYPLYYYAKIDSTLEIDFVIHDHSTIGLIEVKSGKNKRSKSLNTLLKEKDRNRKGYKVCKGNVSIDENGAIHLPLYGVAFLDESCPPDVPSLDIDDVNGIIDRRLGSIE